METQLREQINVVVLVRSIAKSNKEILEIDRKAWEEANKEQIDLVALTKQDAEEAETKLRELALETYAEVGDKTVAPGIGIRIMTRLNYEAKEAMGWAMEHKLALKLDSSAFEKIAKTSNLSFVTISEEPQATIATELQEIEVEK